jgi:hypothetical protein
LFGNYLKIGYIIPRAKNALRNYCHETHRRKSLAEPSETCGLGRSAGLEAAQEKAFNKVASKVSIPGFRPGKAPKELIKEKVNQEAVL